MRILMLTDSMDSGGAETHLLELSSGLRRRGHRVCVVSSGGALVSELVRRGVFHIELPINKYRGLFAVPRLCRLVRIGGFDVIHSHTRVSSFIASRVSKKTGICFVSTVHAHFSLVGLRRRFSRWGRKNIAVSDDLKDYLTQNYGVSPEDVTVIPNGVDVSRFCPDTRARDKGVRIVFLSRLDGECSLGAFLLCDIARELTENFKITEIVIGGGGDALECVRERVREVNSELGFECVKAVGRVEDVPSFLRGADIFVGVSRAAIEASFCGASVVICGDEGFLGALDEDNFALALSSNFCARGQGGATAEALCCELSKLLRQDASLRRKNALQLRELMLGECELGATVEKTENFYRRALTAPKKEYAEVVLCGYYGFGNLGDDALLRAAIERARREFGGARIAAITKNGKRDSERFGIWCIARRDFKTVLAQINGCAHFVFGGGTLLQDSTSRRSIIYYASLLALAKRSGAKCYLWGNGIGEPRSEKSEKIIASALSDCEYIGLRDARSVDIAKRLLKDTSRIVLERDLAEEERELFLSGEDRLPEEDFVIVALKGKSCPRELDECIKSEKEKGRKLVFVAMFPSQDLKLCRKYSKKYSGVIKSDIDFSDLVCLARHSAGVYSMRFHALVAAKLANVSFRGFGDSKVTDFGKLDLN